MSAGLEGHYREKMEEKEVEVDAHEDPIFLNRVIRTGMKEIGVESMEGNKFDDLMVHIKKMCPGIDLNRSETMFVIRKKIQNRLKYLERTQHASVGTGKANNTLTEILTENETAAESLNKETVVSGDSALEGPSNRMAAEGYQDGDSEDEDDELAESDESEIFETLDNSSLNKLVKKGIEKFKLKSLKEEKMDKLMKYIQKKCPSIQAIKPETTKEIRKKVSRRLRTLRCLQSGGLSYRRNSENAVETAEKTSTSLTVKTLKKLRFVPKPIPKDKLRAKLKVSLFHEGHAVATGKIIQYPLQTYDIEDFKREEFAQLKITKMRKYTTVTVAVLPYPKDKRSWSNIKKGNTIIWPLKDLCSHSAFLKNMRTGRLARQLQRSGRKSSSEISEILTDAKITAESVAIQEKDLIMEVTNETIHDGDSEDENENDDSDSDYQEESVSDELAESDESEIFETLDYSCLNNLVRKGIEKFGVKHLKEENTDKLMKYIQEKCPATDSPEIRKEIRKKISQRLRTLRFLQSDREYSETAMRKTEITSDALILKKLHFVPKLIPRDKLRAKLKVSLFNDGHAVALGEIIQYPLWKYDIEDSMREEFAQLEITKTRRYTRVPVLPYPKDKRSWSKMKKGNTIIWPVKDMHSLESYEKNVEAENLAKKLQRNRRSDILTKAKLTAESLTSQGEDDCGNTTMEDSNRVENDEGDHGADSEDEDDDSHYQEDEESDVPDILDTLEFVNNSAMNKLVRKGIEKFDVETMKGEKMDNLMEYIKKKCQAIDFNSREGRSMIRAKISMKLRFRRFLQSDREYNENAKPKRILNPMLRLQKLRFVPRPILREKLRVKLKVSLFNDGHAVALGKIIQYPLQTYDIEDSLRNELVQVEIVKMRRYSTVKVLPYPKDNRSWSDIKVGKTIIWPVKDLCQMASFRENVDAENMAKILQRGGLLRKHSSDISEILTKAKLTAESLNRKDGSGNSSITDSTMEVTDETRYDEEDGGDSDQSEVFETADNSSINVNTALIDTSINKVIRRGLDKVKVKSMRDKNVDKVIGYIKEKCPAIDLNSPEMMKEVRKKISQRIRSRNSLQSDRSYNEYAPPKGALPLPIERLYFVPKFVPKERLRPELEVSLFHDDHAVAIARIKQYPLEYDIDDSMKADFVQVELTNIRRFATVKVLPYPKDTRRWADLTRRSTVIWPVKHVCYKISYEENVRAENFAKKLQRNRNVFTEDARSVTEILTKARIAFETMNPPVVDSTVEDEKWLGDETEQAEEVIETVSLPKAIRQGMEKFKVQSMKENLDDLLNYIQKACPSVDLSIPENTKKVKMKISQRLRHFRFLSSDRFYAGESKMAARKHKFVQKEIPREQLKPRIDSLEVSLFNDGHAVATGKIVQYPLQHYDVEVTMRKEFALLEITKLRRGSTVKELPYPKDGRHWKTIKKGSAVIWPMKDICQLASFQENIDAENRAKIQIRNREYSNKKKTSGGGRQITYKELGTSLALPTEQSTAQGNAYGYSDGEDNIEDEDYFNDTSEDQPPAVMVSNQPETQETVNTPTLSVFKKISATLSDELVTSVDQATLNSVLSKVTEKLTLTVNWCPGNPTPEYTLTGRLEDILLTQDMLYKDALKKNHPGTDTAKLNNKSNTQGKTSDGNSLKTSQRTYTNLYTLPKKRKHDGEKETPKIDHRKKKDTSSAGGNVDTNCVKKSENMTKKGSQTATRSSHNTNVKTMCHNNSVSVTTPTHSKHYSTGGKTLNFSAMEGGYQEFNKLEDSNVHTQSTNIGSTTQIVTPERIGHQGPTTRVDGVSDDNPTMFVCSECNAVFNSFMEVETHVLLAHTDCLTKDGGYAQPQYVMDGAVVTQSVASQQIVDVYAQASMIINDLQDAAVHDHVTSNHHSV